MIPDFADVRGLQRAKRALQIAAVGEHTVLLMGPPGSGRTMLARRLPGIRPLPTLDEAAAIAWVRGYAHLPRLDPWTVTLRWPSRRDTMNKSG